MKHVLGLDLKPRNLHMTTVKAIAIIEATERKMLLMHIISFTLTTGGFVKYCTEARNHFSSRWSECTENTFDIVKNLPL